MKFEKFFKNKEKIEKMKGKELIKMIKNEIDKVNETTTTIKYYNQNYELPEETPSGDKNTSRNGSIMRNVCNSHMLSQ